MVAGSNPAGCTIVLFMTKHSRLAHQLSGRELVEFIKVRQLHQVRGLKQHFESPPRLAIIQTVDNKIVDVYTGLKCDYAADIEVDASIYQVPMAEVLPLVDQLNADDTVKGIVVQLPLADPSMIDQVVERIKPSKDVDGLGSKAKWDAPAAVAVNWLLAGYNVNLAGKLAIIGTDRLVARPLARLWHSSGLAVTTYDSISQAIPQLGDYDVIVVAENGKLAAHSLKTGATIIDAAVATIGGSINEIIGKSILERSDLNVALARGGVGPLIIAALMDNVIRASY